MTLKITLTLAILAMSGILSEINAIRCHHCIDQTVWYHSPEMNQQLRDSGASDQMERCNQTHEIECDEWMDVCVTDLSTFSATVEGIRSNTSIAHRTCGHSSNFSTDGSGEESPGCNYFRLLLEYESSQGKISVDSFTCETEVCRTDLCNTHGSSLFEERAERRAEEAVDTEEDTDEDTAEDTDEDTDEDWGYDWDEGDYMSSEIGLNSSTLVIVLLALLNIFN